MLNAKALRDVVRTGIELTTEKNKNRLWENMLRKAMSISHCDAGTLYLLEEDGLHFCRMFRKTYTAPRTDCFYIIAYSVI